MCICELRTKRIERRLENEILYRIDYCDERKCMSKERVPFSLLRCRCRYDRGEIRTCLYIGILMPRELLNLQGLFGSSQQLSNPHWNATSIIGLCMRMRWMREDTKTVVTLTSETPDARIDPFLSRSRTSRPSRAPKFLHWIPPS